MVDIKWSVPYVVKSGAKSMWRREWCIPTEMLSNFFEFWKKNRFKLLADGFSVSKSEHSDKWYLFETKNSTSLFKIFGESPTIPDEDDNFVLPSYEIEHKNGLRPWQIDAAGKLVSAIKHWNAAIDGSDTGTGKTYTACAVARELGYKIFIVCPKAVIKSWEKVINEHFKMQDSLITIINYEALIPRKVKKKKGETGRKTRKINHDFAEYDKKIIWKLPKNTLIIWDESQKLKNFTTQNAKMCMAAFKQSYPMLFCSATNATNPLEMRAVGTVLKIFDDNNASYYGWARKHGVYDGDWGLEFNNDPKILKKLSKTIFEKRGVRLRRDTIPNFPQCEIISNVYNMAEEDVKHINQIYANMKEELKKLNNIKKQDKEKESDSALVIRLRARQAAELIKVPLFVDLIKEALEQAFSVAVFVNFTDTLMAIAKRLDINCIFDGKTSDDNRNRNVQLFQEDKERVILVNIQSGGAGLSLHDLNGNFPRLSIISPNDSAVLMRQCLGRIWRDSAKTKAVQKIIFVADTIEEEVCKNVQTKLNNLDALNDGDLMCENKIL